MRSAGAGWPPWRSGRRACGRSGVRRRPWGRSRSRGTQSTSSATSWATSVTRSSPTCRERPPTSCCSSSGRAGRAAPSTTSRATATRSTGLTRRRPGTSTATATTRSSGTPRPRPGLRWDFTATLPTDPAQHGQRHLPAGGRRLHGDNTYDILWYAPGPRHDYLLDYNAGGGDNTAARTINDSTTGPRLVRQRQTDHRSGTTSRPSPTTCGTTSPTPATPAASNTNGTTTRSPSNLQRGPAERGHLRVAGRGRRLRLGLRPGDRSHYDDLWPGVQLPDPGDFFGDGNDHILLAVGSARPLWDFTARGAYEYRPLDDGFPAVRRRRLPFRTRPFAATDRRGRPAVRRRRAAGRRSRAGRPGQLWPHADGMIRGRAALLRRPTGGVRGAGHPR